MKTSLFGGTEPQRDASDTKETDVMDDLESCSAHLHAFCGGFHADQWSESNGRDDESHGGSHSAAEIAGECLALLESLSITIGDDDDAHDVDEIDMIDHSLIPSQPSSETALLREINDLGSELQALMAALSEDASQKEATLVTENPVSDVETPKSICMSPKMVALTKRLERRPSTQRMLVHTALRRHRPFPLELQLSSPAQAKKKKERESATRVVLSDAAFWRHYQSKTLQRHLSRQSQARMNQQRENEKQAKAVQYRYRRVAKPCYPLAKHVPGPIDVALKTNHLGTVQLPGVSTKPNKSYRYAERFTSGNHHAKDPEGRDGLLCGVYLHGKRRSHGMLYITCTSMEQLKVQLATKFSLEAPVVNIYREQIASDSNGNRQRKYLHRVTRFEELHDGDLLCATTSGFDDMAILCAWMKQRQEKIHHITSPQKPPIAPVKKADAIPMKNSMPRETVTYKRPPPAPPVKLWDGNGRVVSICQRLPLAE